MHASAMSREEMIRTLVAHSVRTALEEPQSDWLYELFEKGFAGYRSFSNSKLRRELELRGLDGVEDVCDPEDELEEPIVEELADSIPAFARDSERTD